MHALIISEAERDPSARQSQVRLMQHGLHRPFLDLLWRPTWRAQCMTEPHSILRVRSVLNGMTGN